MRVAVVGSGPAGFYLSQALLKHNSRCRIDMLEKSPVPFGLVRYGVAPDHPEVKNVIHSFTKSAADPRFRFFGNINLGTDVTLSELRAMYDGVALCYGSGRDRPLGIEGENESNVMSARRFVGWYNGVPADQDLNPNLISHDACTIIGHGNVALDCARILLSPSLASTDITLDAHKKLAKSSIKKVHLIGRRGPLQVSFTIKELREMATMEGLTNLFDPVHFDPITNDVLNKLARPRKRLTQLMIDMKNKMPPTIDPNGKQLNVHFCKSPIKIEKQEDILQTHLQWNQLDDQLSEGTKIKPTSDPTRIDETIPSALVIKSVGYQTVSIDPILPMDDKRGCIHNSGGRVTNLPGVYCSGWAAVGPTGVLASTMNISFDVAKNIAQDLDTKTKDTDSTDQFVQLLDSRKVKYVTFDDWTQIDKLEVTIGEKLGKTREKLVHVEDMMMVIDKKDT